MSDEVHTATKEIDEITDRLRRLVNWLNQRSAWDAALRAQHALLQVDAIHSAPDADLEESYP